MVNGVPREVPQPKTLEACRPSGFWLWERGWTKNKEKNGRAPRPAQQMSFELATKNRLGPLPAPGKLLGHFSGGADSDRWSDIGGQLAGCDSDTLSVNQQLDSCDSVILSAKSWMTMALLVSVMTQNIVGSILQVAPLNIGILEYCGTMESPPCNLEF